MIAFQRQKNMYKGPEVLTEYNNVQRMASNSVRPLSGRMRRVQKRG